MSDFRPSRALRALLLAGGVAAAGVASAQSADYIVAIVDREVVTAAEVQQRMKVVREEAERSRAPLPPPAELRRQVLDQLINERVMVVNARESGVRVDEQEIDRAVTNVATQNQLTLAQLRQRLLRDGVSFARFRDNVKDQMLVERSREREVTSRIKISDADIDALIDQHRASVKAAPELNLAQILVTVPDNATPEIVAERRDRAARALARVRGGEDFATVAREISEDGNRARGGEIGMRSAERLPDIFVAAVRDLRPGQIAPELLRSDAGWHVLKVVDRKDNDAFQVTQTRVRHILLRPSAELTPEAATQRLLLFKKQILSGERTFEQLARQNSEDGSAAQGGDLGWTMPGTFVPEFEDAINELPIGGLSDPITTRFGIHLAQVVERRQITLDRRQQREQARNVLKEQKFEEAYAEWLRDLRSRAYVELREPPAVN